MLQLVFVVTDCQSLMCRTKVFTACYKAAKPCFAKSTNKKLGQELWDTLQQEQNKLHMVGLTTILVPNQATWQRFNS